MKKFTLLLTGLLLVLTVHAGISIESGKNYTFTCMNWNSGIQGYMVLGANHGAVPYVYYDVTQTVPSADAYWTITMDGAGFTIRNAESGQYLVYAEGRPTNGNGEYLAKGIQLADNVSDDTGRWMFYENYQGVVYVENVGVSGQYFNVRTDNTYLVGTYANYTSDNSLFVVRDEAGNSIVTENGGGGDVITPDPLVGDSGVEDGLYWERTGLAQPVVYTTNVSNPVLYTIRNVRSCLNVVAADYQLNQSAQASTQFYFVQNGDGVNIFTEDGQYVSTYYTTNNTPLSLSGSTPNGNIWAFGFASDTEVTSYGYTIGKVDNLPDASAGGWWGSFQSEYLYWNDLQQSSICLYDVDDGSTFVFLSSDERHLEHLTANGVVFEGVRPSGVKGYVKDIRINGKEITYDSAEGCYYCALPAAARGGNDLVTTLTAEMVQTDAAYELRIGEFAADAEGNITIPAVNCATPYTLSVVKEGMEVVAEAPLNFTFLPIVEVNVYGDNGSYYVTGSIRVSDPNIAGYDSTFIAAYKWRGATAMGKSKKSYAVKLRDENGNSIDREFFGLRNDNNWILDAMAIDPACMRNRVSTDLWNDFSEKPYHRRAGFEKKARTGTRGKFVEVFLNGKYHGLYCMTEKMDRKQLKLKKYTPATETSVDTIHGTLYKSSQWSYEVLMGHEEGSRSFPKYAPMAYNNSLRSETWSNYEIKYPDWEEEPIDWGPLWNAVNFVATSEDRPFESGISEWFDMPVLIDYYLFIELMLATDNHGKNMFFFNYDKIGKRFSKMIGIAPWDLDGVWGRRWDGSNDITVAAQDFDAYLWDYEHGNHTIYYRLQKSLYWDWANMLKERYVALRPGAFSKEALIKRFTDYLDLFTESGAAGREENRWYRYHSDIAGDVDYISEWISDRIDYLDNQYGYVPVVDGIQSPVTDDRFVSVSGGNGSMTFRTGIPATVNIYNVGGVLLRTVHLSQPQTTLDGFSAGVYIVEGQKVIVR